LLTYEDRAIHVFNVTVREFSQQGGSAWVYKPELSEVEREAFRFRQRLLALLAQLVNPRTHEPTFQDQPGSFL